MESLTLQLRLCVCASVCVYIAGKSYWHLRGKRLKAENQKGDEVRDGGIREDGEQDVDSVEE